MHIILNNPYRVVGLLVGATAREQERQVKRLKQFLEAEQDPQDDFSFPTLGSLHRTLDKVNEAASKLNLDSDKISSALFWFYDGKTELKTDEDAFNSIKEADLDQVLNIWTKLTSNGEVSQRNASAYSNLGTLYLSGILEGTNTKETLLEQGISLKMKFLESDLITDFKASATDETYKTTKKELQLLFLNLVQSELENSGGLSSNKFLDIITKQEFSAKEDFLKGFVQKPIEQIENKVEEAKTKRKASKAKAAIIGKALYEQTSENLNLLKSTLGTSNLRFSSISDKVSEEILQCGIDYFLHYKDSSTDLGSASMDLFRKAKTLAIGNIAKQRCQENRENLQQWMDEKPEREQQKLILNELNFILSQLDKFQSLSENISNARKLIDSCKPKLIIIKEILGSNNEFYINISSTVVHNAQNMLIQAVNKIIEKSKTSMFRGLSTTDKSRIENALDLTFKMGLFHMNSNLNVQYKKNLDGIKNIVKQLGLSTLSPKEKIELEISQSERKLNVIKNAFFFKDEFNAATIEMAKIKEWQFLRSKSDREAQIMKQENKILQIKTHGDEEKASQIKLQQKRISDLKIKLRQTEY